MPATYRRFSQPTFVPDHASDRVSRRSERCHVAAVCFRLKDGGVEFLLVRTRAGRWTFPKGGVDGDRTFAAAAAREAFEEAGVRGYVEENRFLRYRYPKRKGFRTGRTTEITIDAHLCHVADREAPDELHRDPTWFSVEKAKRRLREGRTLKYAEELSRVVDSAASRILRRYAN